MLEFLLDPQSGYFKKEKLDMDKEMVLFCASGLRSTLSVKSLKEVGFKNFSNINSVLIY